MIKKHRKKRAKRKRLLIILLVLLCILAALVIIGIKGFQIHKVQVSGNELYTDEQIKESVLNDKYSWNALYVVLKHRFFKMQEVPFIDEMEVELVSMHTIKINVYEKAIIGYIAANDQNVYFDKDGFVVEISKRLIDHVPKVEGIECNEVVVYEKLDLDDKHALSILLTFSQQLSKYGLVPKTIAFQDKKSLSADFGNVIVEMGDSEYLVEKVMRLNSIMPQLAGKSGTLHLENWTPLTTDVFFAPV